MNLNALKYTVHRYLDGIWLLSSNKRKSRTLMYKWLSEQMGLTRSETHVKYFNRKQCIEAIKILKPKYIQLYGHDLQRDNKDDNEEVKRYMEQSPDIIHMVYTLELQDLLDCNDIDVMVDNRPKIEDVDFFKRRLKMEFDNDIYNKITSFMDNYMQFYNK